MSRAVALAGLAGALAALAAPGLLSMRPRAADQAPRMLPSWLRQTLRRRSGADAGARRLEAAGLSPAFGGGDLIAIKSLSLLAGCSIGAGLILVLGPALIALVAVLAPSSYLAPDLFVKLRVNRRRAQIERELPDLLDLLAVAIRAGMPPTRALTQVAAHRRGLLAAELRAAESSVNLGERRSDSLEVLRRRCPGEGVAILVAALDRAHRHGAPLAPALDAIACDARVRRAQAIRERAAKAAPKVQLVIALGLVPATLLLVAAALAGSLADAAT